MCVRTALSTDPHESRPNLRDFPIKEALSRLNGDSPPYTESRANDPRSMPLFQGEACITIRVVGFEPTTFRSRSGPSCQAEVYPVKDSIHV